MKDNFDIEEGATSSKKTHNNYGKKIITQKEINYIDTLYLSCNLQDFFIDDFVKCYDITQKDIELFDNKTKYHFVKIAILKPLLSNSSFLGDANGYSWYKLENYRLGVMDYDKSKKANQPNIVIQYEHKHIFELGFDLTNLELPFGDDLSKYKIKRIDITKTAKVSKNYTYGYGYISPFRSHPFKYSRVGETTIYLGHRSNGCVFRIYDKSAEMKQSEDYSKIALFEDIFEDVTKDLYTFELELRRSYLRDALGIDNLSQFEDLLKASFNFISKIKFIEDTPSNRKKVEQNNRKIIKYEYLTEYVEFKRPKKKKYKRSYRAMVNRLKKEIHNYLSAYPADNSAYFYMKLFNDIAKDVSDGKDIEFYIDDSDFKKSYDDMFKKFAIQRENQDKSSLAFDAHFYMDTSKFRKKIFI